MRYRMDLTMPKAGNANSIISFAGDRGCTATLTNSVGPAGKPIWRYESDVFAEVKTLLEDLKGLPLTDEIASDLIIDTANTA